MKESDIEKLCRMEAAQNGLVLFRNARGYDRERKVKYGLGPDGASDEIGFYTVTITPEMVGKQVAVFAAIEIKTPGGKTDKERLHNQKKFVANIRKRGGMAGFAQSPECIKRIIRNYLTALSE
ncbi:MAG: hypothetical protein ACUZ8E_17300 [Candidatus Anammoxibacter sp.]